MLKRVIKNLPVIGPLAKRAKRLVTGAPPTPHLAPPPIEFTTSGDYWEARYKAGGNSGAGSYGRLARYKADYLNDFVRREAIGSIVEFGSGDGAQLELAHYPGYIGVDVSPTMVERSRARFGRDARFRFLHASEVPADLGADLTLSLDVIYHLVEDEVFDRYMRQLFDAARRAVIIYASDEDKPQVDPHVRHRRFTDWVRDNRPDFALTGHEPNPYPFDESEKNDTSFADFHVFRKLEGDRP